MPFQWRQPRVRQVHTNQSVSVKGRKWGSRWWHSCFPRLCTQERVPRRRPPITKSFSDQALIDEKTPTDSPRLLLLFQETKTTDKTGGEREEQSPHVPSVKHYDAELETFPPSSETVAALGETYSPQNKPDEQCEVEHPERGSVHLRNRTESLANQADHYLNPCPSETRAISSVDSVKEKGCTSEHITINAEQQDKDTLSCASFDSAEEQKAASRGPEAPSRPREIVVVLSWDKKEKRTIKRRKRRVASPIRKKIFPSPSRTPASYLSTSSSNAYNDSGSSVRRSKTLSSRSSSGSSAGRREERSSSESPVEGWHRRSWFPCTDTDHVDESEVYSCSSVASSTTFSPPQSVFFSPCTQKDRQFATNIWKEEQNRDELYHGGIQRTVARTKAVITIRKEEPDVPPPLEQDFPISLHQNEHGDPSAGAPQVLPSTSSRHKVRYGTGNFRPFQEVACNVESTSKDTQNGFTKVLKGPGSSGRDVGPRSLHPSLFSSSPSASTTSTKPNASETPSPYGVGTVGQLQGTRLPKFSQIMSRFPACLRRNITSLFPFSRMAPPAGHHYKNTHSASLCIQHLRFSKATQGRTLPRLSLPSTCCREPTRARAPASTRNKTVAAQPPSRGVGALEHETLINSTASLPFPCTACLSESCKSKLQALPLLSRVVRVSHPVATADNRGRCVNIDGAKTGSVKARTFLSSRSKNLPLTHPETARERPFWTGSHIGMGQQLSAVKSSSIIHPPYISCRQERPNETSATNGTQKRSETEAIRASEVASCLTLHSCSLPPTCDTADSTLLSASSLCTLVSGLAVKLRKEVGKGERTGEKTGKLGKTKVTEQRPQQPRQQRQRELGRCFDPSSLMDLDTLYTSHGRALEAHNSSGSATVGAPPRRTISRISAANVREQSLTGETEKCTSPAASTREFTLAACVTVLQEEAPLGSAPRQTSTRPLDSAPARSASTSVDLVDSTSNASCFLLSSSSRAHFQKVEQAQSNSGIQRTERVCAAGELRASCVDSNSRSQVNFTDKENSKTRGYSRTAEGNSGKVKPPTNASYLGGALGGARTSVGGKEVDERRSGEAGEAIREVRPEEMVRYDSPHQVMQSEPGESRRLTDEERTLEFTSPAKQQIGTTPVPPPFGTLPTDAAVGSRADENGLAVLLGGGAHLASSCGNTKENVSFVCAAVQNPNCTVARATEKNDMELAKLPCVSSPITQLVYSRRSPAPQQDAPKDAAAPSAGVDSTCAADTIAEDTTDTARSLRVCEGGELVLAHQKDHAVCPMPSVALRLEKTGGETVLSTEILSHSERILSAVGLGFTSVVELGATALRNLLTAQFEEVTVASLANTITGNNSAGGGVSVLNSKASYTCVSPSPSMTFSLQAGCTAELCEQRQETSKQLINEREKDRATDTISCTASPCGTIASPQVRFDAATRTTARSPVTTCVETGTSNEAPHLAAVSIAEQKTSPDAGIVAREGSVIAGSVVASVAPVVTTHDEDPSAVTLSRFRSASFCGAVTPAPAAFSSPSLPVRCSSTTSAYCSNWSATLLACGPVESNTFDSSANRRTVAPIAVGAGQRCQPGNLTCYIGKAHGAAVFQKGKLATANQRDALRTAPRATAPTSTNLTSSHIHIIGSPVTSLTASSSVPPKSLHPPGLTEGSGIAEKFNIGDCPPSDGSSSSQRARKICCCHRSTTVEKSSRPCESSVTSSGGVPSTCSRSRSLSEVVQAGSRFSVVLLLRCLRPFTTKWDGQKKNFDSFVSLDTDSRSSKNPCPPAAHEPCRIDRVRVQSRDMAISVEENPRKSGAENRVYIEAMQPAVAETQQIQAAGADKHTSDAPPAGALAALIEAPDTCSVSKPSLEGSAAEEIAAMTAKSLMTAEMAGPTDVAPANRNKREEPVRPGCIDSSSQAVHLGHCPENSAQCISRRVKDSVVRRNRTGTPRKMTLPPTFPLLLHEGLSISWPQCGAQSTQQQRLLPQKPQGIDSERQEKQSQQQRAHQPLLHENPEKPVDGQSRPQVQQEVPQDVQQHSKLPTDRQQLEKLQNDKQQVEEAQLHKKQHAKQHTVEDQREAPHPKQQRSMNAHQRRCLLQTAVPLQRVPTRPSQLAKNRAEPRARERSRGRPAASTPPPLSVYKYEHRTQSDVGYPCDAPTNCVRRCTAAVLLPLSIAVRKQAHQVHKACPDSLRGDVQFPLRTSSFTSRAFAGRSPASLHPPYSTVLRSPPCQPARSDCLGVTDCSSSIPHAFHATVRRIASPCVLRSPAAAPRFPRRLSPIALPAPFPAALRSNQRFSTFPPHVHRTGMLLIPQQLQPHGKSSAHSGNCNTQSTMQRSVRQSESSQSSTMQTDPHYHRCNTIRHVWHDNGKSIPHHKPCTIVYTGEARLQQQQLDLSPDLSSRSEITGNEVRMYSSAIRSSVAQTAVELHENNTIYYSSVQRLLRFHGSQRSF